MRRAPAARRLALGLGEQRARQAAAAGVAAHAQAAEPRGSRALEDDAAGPDQRAVLRERDDVDGLVVAAVTVGVEGHALLVAEHLLAQRQRRRDLLLIACDAELRKRA